MRTVSIFKNGKNQAVRLPKDLEFDDVNELEIHKEGDVITLRPVRPDWLSFTSQEKADSDFMVDREDAITDEGRFSFELGNHLYIIYLHLLIHHEREANFASGKATNSS